MARDDLARELEPERSPLDRRSHLTLAGATAASPAATDAAAPAGAPSSETFTVPAGELRQFAVGDAFENERIDSTTDGASAGTGAAVDSSTAAAIAGVDDGSQ